MTTQPLKIRISGLEETFANLNKAVDKRFNEVDNEMAASVEMMATTAKQIFPSPEREKERDKYTAIRASIRSAKNADFNYTLSAGYGNDPKNPDHAMAAYIEFGTGRFFPLYIGKEKEWQDLALQYKRSGRGWMMPSPYFYPAVTQGFSKLMLAIKQILTRDERL